MAEQIESLVNDISKKIELLTPEGWRAWENQKDMLEEELKTEHTIHYDKKMTLSDTRKMKEMGNNVSASLIRGMHQDAIHAENDEAEKQKELEGHLKKILSSIDAEEHIRIFINPLPTLPEMPLLRREAISDNSFIS